MLAAPGEVFLAPNGHGGTLAALRTSGALDHMRERGIGVIHGGKNALRFTPHFRVTSEELKLIVEAIRDALLNGPTIS